MNVIANISTIGIIAALVVTTFLYLIQFLKIADTNMITAIGSLFTQNLKKAFGVGLTIHLIAGVFFAFVYLGVASYFGFHTWRDFIFFGSIIGLAHGIVVSIMMVVLVAEHHPLRRVRRKGFTVVAAHGFAHVIYGLTVGLSAAFLRPNLEAMSIFGMGLL